MAAAGRPGRTAALCLPMSLADISLPIRSITISSGWLPPLAVRIRVHDLRHSYAVAAIKSEDDIKTVQGNLGHATASFTLDIYGHVTDQMKRESAQRMEKFIQSVSGS